MIETAVKGVGFGPALTLQSAVAAHGWPRKPLPNLGPLTHRVGREAVLRVALHPGFRRECTIL